MEPPSVQIQVQVEDDIYSFAPADNGAGPLWCHGSTVVARSATRPGSPTWRSTLVTASRSIPTLSRGRRLPVAYSNKRISMTSTSSRAAV